MQSGFLSGIKAALEFGYDRMKKGLEGLSPEQLTTVPAGLKNSIATLVLHTYGVEMNFAHRLMGKAAAEEIKEEYLLHLPQNPLPAAQGETVESLSVKMDKARATLFEAFESMTDADLDKEYELPNGRKLSFRYLVTLLPQHQGQHFGQIQYIKQLNG